MPVQEIKTKPVEAEVSKLADALCKFKQLSISIKKGSNNPFFKSKYADLPTILEAVEEELANLGVVIRSASLKVDDEWVLATVIEHKESREAIQSMFPIFGSKAQDIGSSITYARRYNIQSLLNLAAEDDDGNAANKGKPIKKTSLVAVAEASKGVDYDELLSKVTTQEEYDALHKEHREAIKALPKSEKTVIINKFKDKLTILTEK